MHHLWRVRFFGGGVADCGADWLAEVDSVGVGTLFGGEPFNEGELVEMGLPEKSIG